MIRAKVIGAGSIGNHLAHALRAYDAEVTMVDVDDAALERTRNTIYPERYGSFDSSIVLAHPDSVGGSSFDLCVIGTPPDTHLAIATTELERNHGVILVEKPLAAPGRQRLLDFLSLASTSNTRVLVGYNQRLKTNTLEFLKQARSAELGPVTAISARMREDWGGILKAHPWLSSATDSYLGYTLRGGGALYEHSHAVDFGLFIAHELGQGRPKRVKCLLNVVTHPSGSYDTESSAEIEMSSGLVISIAQDLYSWPPDKSLDAVFANGHLRWEMHNDRDRIVSSQTGQPVRTLDVPKVRPDDFLPEISHILKLIQSEEEVVSPLDVSEVIYTAWVLEAALESAQTGDWVSIGGDA